MKNSFRFCTMLLCGAGFWGISAPATPQTFLAEKPLGEIERSMENNLNWNLQNALLVYYPETKFVVNAKVVLRKVEPKRVLPKLPDALLTKDLTNLPGLPYLPQNLAEPQDEPALSNLRRQVVESGYEVEQIRVNVLVDQSLAENDWSFIRRFVSLTADLESTRGDQVRIEGLEFPEKSDFLSPQKQEPEPEKMAQTPEPPVTETEEAGFDWLPYLFAAGLAVFLLVLFLVGMRSIVKHLQQPTNPGNMPDSAASLDVRSAMAGQPENGSDESAKSVERLRTAAIDAIVGAPGASAKVLNGWVEEMGETGVFQTAVLITTVSKSLLDVLEPHLGQETAMEVQNQMFTIDQVEIDKHAPAVLRQFDQEIRKLVLQDKYENHNDALAFLQQMSDDQLQHLLKPLKTGVMAIVLAQLRANRAAKMLEKLSSDERKSVLAAIGNIDRIPSDVYQHIARQLAVRAHDLKKMRYVRANGVDVLVKVLDHLDETAQTDALDYLQTRDLALAEKVSKHFMTFDQLIGMPSDKIREVALEVDRETLAKSLLTVDEQTVEKILQSLPEKLGELVRASLESNSGISEDEVSEARRSLMRTLRGKKAQKVSA